MSLQEYMAFMISRETENVKSSEEIESAFRALSAENKPYVTKEELYQVRNTPAVIVACVQVREKTTWRCSTCLASSRLNYRKINCRFLFS